MADMKDVIKKVVSSKEGYNVPVVSYKLIYDSQQYSFEPIYYWILDFLNNLFSGDVTKIVDNFMSSPGSGHFLDMSQRLSKMQEEGMKILGGLNQVVKSSLNLIYDLREFKERLQHYVDAESTNTELKKAANLSLKNVWLDSVDVSKRGRGSIHQMASELGYSTLREAFLVADSIEDVTNMEKEGDINESVGRILKPRVKEFIDWKKHSYNELKKRYNIEKSYLKSQVETIKLYSSWIKPYLAASKQLQQKGFHDNAALVNAFSTTMFELTLFAKREVKLPDKIEHYKDKMTRKYYSCVIIDFKQRSQLLQKVTQKGDYAPIYGGKLEINFDAYALNSEELELVNKTLEKENFDELLSFNSNMAEDALKELRKDIEEFLEEKEMSAKEENDKKRESKELDINPFSALFGGVFKKTRTKQTIEKKKIEKTEDISQDNWYEKHVRIAANNDAGSKLYTIYDVYKKAHGMASSPQPFSKGEKTESDSVKLKELLKESKKS